MKKIRICTKQGQTFDCQWPDDQFNFESFTASMRAIGCIALPIIFIPLSEVQYIISLDAVAGGPEIILPEGATKQ